MHISLVPFEVTEGRDLLYVYVDGEHVGHLMSCGENSWAVFARDTGARLTTTETVFGGAHVLLNYAQQQAA